MSRTFSRFAVVDVGLVPVTFWSQLHPLQIWDDVHWTTNFLACSKPQNVSTFSTLLHYRTHLFIMACQCQSKGSTLTQEYPASLDPPYFDKQGEGDLGLKMENSRRQLYKDDEDGRSRTGYCNSGLSLVFLWDHSSPIQARCPCTQN